MTEPIAKTSQDIRIWAAEEGIDCTISGPVPMKVRAAWERSFGVSLYILPSRNTRNKAGIDGEHEDDAYWREDWLMQANYNNHLRRHEDVYTSPDCTWCEDEPSGLSFAAYREMVQLLAPYIEGTTPEARDNRAKVRLQSFILSHVYPTDTDPRVVWLVDPDEVDDE